MSDEIKITRLKNAIDRLIRDDYQCRTLVGIVGLKVRRIRESYGWTRAELARLLGHPEDHLAKIELGQRDDMRLGELIEILAALQIPLADITGPEFLAWLAGDGREIGQPPRPPSVDLEERLATALGASVKEVIAASIRLWGRSFTEERDARVAALRLAGPAREERAARGHITRVLKSEFLAAVAGVADARP